MTPGSLASIWAERLVEAASAGLDGLLERIVADAQLTRIYLLVPGDEPAAAWRCLGARGEPPVPASGPEDWRACLDAREAVTLLPRAGADLPACLESRGLTGLALVRFPAVGGRQGVLGLERSRGRFEEGDAAALGAIAGMIAVAIALTPPVDRHEAANHLTSLVGAATILDKQLAGPLNAAQASFAAMILQQARKLDVLLSGGDPQGDSL